MLDIKRIRQNPEALAEAMKNRRNKGADISELLELDRARREQLASGLAVTPGRLQVGAQRVPGGARLADVGDGGGEVLRDLAGLLVGGGELLRMRELECLGLPDRESDELADGTDETAFTL